MIYNGLVIKEIKRYGQSTSAFFLCQQKGYSESVKISVPLSCLAMAKTDEMKAEIVYQRYRSSLKDQKWTDKNQMKNDTEA